jgi:hypothetical protein
MFILQDYPSDRVYVARVKPMILSKLDSRFDPPLAFSVRVMNVNMEPRLLPGEKEEPVAANSKDCRAHKAIVPSGPVAERKKRPVPEPAFV